MYRYFLFAGKKSTDFTSWLSGYNFEKNDYNGYLNNFELFHFELYKTNLADQKKFRLNEISKIES